MIYTNIIILFFSECLDMLFMLNLRVFSIIGFTGLREWTTIETFHHMVSCATLFNYSLRCVILTQKVYYWLNWHWVTFTLITWQKNLQVLLVLLIQLGTTYAQVTLWTPTARQLRKVSIPQVSSEGMSYLHVVSYDCDNQFYCVLWFGIRLYRCLWCEHVQFYLSILFSLANVCQQ